MQKSLMIVALLVFGISFSQSDKKVKVIEEEGKYYDVEYDMSYLKDEGALFNFTIKNEAQGLDTHFEDQGKLYKVVFYHPNGKVAQKGFMTKDKKLHGTWKSFDTNGKKTSMGHYENGKRTGKWLFWNKESLTEIDYKDYKIESIHEWTGKTQLAVGE